MGLTYKFIKTWINVIKWIGIIIFSVYLCALLTVNKSIVNNLTFLPRFHRTTHSKNCTIILNNPTGRLGNVLFEFAAAYGLSLEHSCRLHVGPHVLDKLNPYFKINVSHLMNTSDLERVKPFKQLYNHCTFFPGLLQPNTSQHIELVGYWQVFKHFARQTNKIKYQLRFKDIILNTVQHFINNVVKNNTISTFVGVHIRRGDFVNTRPMSSNKFIFEAMNYFIKKYQLINFIFTSDDKEYCRDVFSGKNNTFVTPDSFTFAEDMATITLCHHAIITVGTFGWWAAFLLQNPNGEVITDGKPNHSPLDVNCEPTVFYPPWFKFLH